MPGPLGTTPATQSIAYEGEGGGAPTTSLYVTGGVDGTLSNELVITGSTWITGETSAGIAKWVIVAGSIGTTQMENDSVKFSKMVNLSGSTTFIGRFSTSAGDPEELSGASATQMLSLYTSTIRGAVPPVVSGTTQFLRADATWQQPPGTGAPTIQYKGTAQTNQNVGTGVDITGLTFALAAGTTYHFEYYMVFASSASTTGLGLGMTFPSAKFWACNTEIPTGPNGTAYVFCGAIIATGGSVTATGVSLSNTSYLATINGVIGNSTAGTLSPIFRSEIAGSTVAILAGSFGKLFTIA